MNDKKKLEVGIDYTSIILYCLGIGSIIFWIVYFINHINIFSIILTSVFALYFIACMIKETNACGKLETFKDLMAQYGTIAFFSFLIWFSFNIISGIIGIIISVFIGIFCLLLILTYLKWAKEEWMIDKQP